MARLASVDLHRLQIPLTTPYKVSRATFDAFRPIFAEVRDADGRSGWGEAEVHHGYTDETPESAWAYCREMADRLVGRRLAEARALIAPTVAANPHAASVLMTAIEMLEGHEALAVLEPATVPLVAPVQSTELAALPDEVEALLASGFRSLKVKVGFDLRADLRRVAAIQAAIAGRATLRLDANQAFSVAVGREFASSLAPEGIELFEQPCDKDDWAANAAVARVSAVPVMLDESIYDLADVERAAMLDGVGFVKVKLKKLGGLTRLTAALHRIRELGLRPVLGDGMATDISCWMEACVARSTISDAAGEMNGFLKLARRLFEPGLPFARAAVQLHPGYAPRIDRDAIARFTLTHERYAPASVVAAG